MKNSINIIKTRKIQLNNYLKLISKRNNKVVININNRYVIKMCSKDILLSQKLFFESYKEKDIYEQILKLNYNKSYIVCKYEKNDSFDKIKEFNNIFIQVKDIVNTYDFITYFGYGDLFDLKDTWCEFLEEEIKHNRKYFTLKNNEEELLMCALENIKKFNFQKKLIHGDLGCYNIIFNGQKIKKIIDARVIIGDPLYDLIFYIFSSSKILKDLNLKKMILEMGEPIEKVKSLMIIILYNRISILIKNNKGIEYYMEKWKEVISL